jgi:hypothetical protein
MFANFVANNDHVAIMRRLNVLVGPYQASPLHLTCQKQGWLVVFCNKKEISFWDTWGPGDAIDQVPKQRTCTCKQEFVYPFKWKIKFLLFHLIVVSALLLMLFAQF